MSTHDTIIRLIGKDSGAKAALHDVKEETDLLAGGMGRLQEALAGIAFGVLAKKAAETVWELSQIAAEAAQVEAAFMRVSEGAGQSGAAIIAAMDAATGRMMDDEAMMQTVTQATIMGLRMTADEWAALAAGATQHARLTGRDILETFQEIVQAIERGQPKALATLGFAGARDAVNEFSDAMDDSAGSMSEAERSGALLRFIMGQINTEAKTFGILAPTMQDALKRQERAWGDLQETMGGMLNSLFRWESTLPIIAQGIITLTAVIKGELKPQQALLLLEAQGIKFLDLLTMSNKQYTAATIAATAAVIDFGDALAIPTVPELPDFAGPIRMAYGLQSETLTKMWEDSQTAAEEAADATQKAWEDAADASAQAWEDLKGAVESALQPTIVTAGDMAATAAGNYVDKWDEAARQLAAISERGFAELAAHPDWAAVLKIPPEVLAGGEAVLKEWAAGAAEDVRSLFRPDLLNIGAAVAEVEQYLAEQAARKQTIQMVAEAYTAKHGGTPADAKAAAVALFGDPADVADAAADGLAAGLTQSLKDTSLTATLTAQWSTDLENNRDKLEGTGKRLWTVLFGGISLAVDQQDPTLMEVLARRLAPAVAEILAAQGWWQGGP